MDTAELLISNLSVMDVSGPPHFDNQSHIFKDNQGIKVHPQLHSHQEIQQASNIFSTSTFMLYKLIVRKQNINAFVM